MNILRRKWQGLPRGMVVLIAALVIYVPLLFIVAQSFLSAPFFARSKEWSLEAFGFIFTDPIFTRLTLWIYPRFWSGHYRDSAGRHSGLFNGTYRFTRQALY